jgi:hypothetical protein
MWSLYASNPACRYRQYSMQIDREVHMLTWSYSKNYVSKYEDNSYQSWLIHM